jgi:hypothetical protein
MTPEQQFYELNQNGCTWESLIYTRRKVLNIILFDANNLSNLELCMVLQLWRLRRFEISALMLDFR